MDKKTQILLDLENFDFFKRAISKEETKYLKLFSKVNLEIRIFFEAANKVIRKLELEIERTGEIDARATPLPTNELLEKIEIAELQNKSLQITNNRFITITQKLLDQSDILMKYAKRGKIPIKEEDFYRIATSAIESHKKLAEDLNAHMEIFADTKVWAESIKKIRGTSYEN